MSRREKLVLLCAPAAISIEWFALVTAMVHFPVNFDMPVSAIPYFYPSYKPIFGITISIVAILLTVFTTSLRHYWSDIIKVSLVCGLLLLVAAWSPYDPYHDGNFWSVVHAGSANLAVIGYTFILFQISQRAHGVLGRATKIFFSLALLGIAGVTVSIHVLDDGSAWFQLFLLMTFQAWALFTAFYLWKKPTTTQ